MSLNVKNNWTKGKPIGKKKAIHLAIMRKMKVLDSIIVEDRTFDTVRNKWVRSVEYHTEYKFIVQSLGTRIHRITRVI